MPSGVYKRKKKANAPKVKLPLLTSFLLDVHQKGGVALANPPDLLYDLCLATIHLRDIKVDAVPSPAEIDDYIDQITSTHQRNPRSLSLLHHSDRRVVGAAFLCTKLDGIYQQNIHFELPQLQLVERLYEVVWELSGIPVWAASKVINNKGGVELPDHGIDRSPILRWNIAVTHQARPKDKSKHYFLAKYSIAIEHKSLAHRKLGTADKKGQENATFEDPRERGAGFPVATKALVDAQFADWFARVETGTYASGISSITPVEVTNKLEEVIREVLGIEKHAAAALPVLPRVDLGSQHWDDFRPARHAESVHLACMPVRGGSLGRSINVRDVTEGSYPTPSDIQNFLAEFRPPHNACTLSVLRHTDGKVRKAAVALIKAWRVGKSTTAGTLEHRLVLMEDILSAVMTPAALRIGGYRYKITIQKNPDARVGSDIKGLHLGKGSTVATLVISDQGGWDCVSTRVYIPGPTSIVGETRDKQVAVLKDWLFQLANVYAPQAESVAELRDIAISTFPATIAWRARQKTAVNSLLRAHFVNVGNITAYRHHGQAAIYHSVINKTIETLIERTATEREIDGVMHLDFHDDFTGEHLMTLAKEQKLDYGGAKALLHSIGSAISLDHLVQMCVIVDENQLKLTMNAPKNIFLTSWTLNRAKHRYPPSIFILLMMLIEVNNRYPKFLPTDAEEDKECLSIVTRLVMLINTIYRTWAMCCPRWQRFAQGVPLLQHNLSMDEHARVSLGLGCHSPIPDWDAYTEGYKTPEYSEVDLRVGPEPRPGRRIGPGPVTAGNITSITQLSRALYDSWSRSPTLSLRRVDPNPMIEYLAQGLDFVRTPQELISIDGSGTEGSDVIYRFCASRRIPDITEASSPLLFYGDMIHTFAEFAKTKRTFNPATPTRIRLTDIHFPTLMFNVVDSKSALQPSIRRDDHTLPHRLGYRDASQSEFSMDELVNGWSPVGGSISPGTWFTNAAEGGGDSGTIAGQRSKLAASAHLLTQTKHFKADWLLKPELTVYESGIVDGFIADMRARDFRVLHLFDEDYGNNSDSKTSEQQEDSQSEEECAGDGAASSTEFADAEEYDEVASDYGSVTTDGDLVDAADIEGIDTFEDDIDLEVSSSEDEDEDAGGQWDSWEEPCEEDSESDELSAGATLENEGVDEMYGEGLHM